MCSSWATFRTFLVRFDLLLIDLARHLEDASTHPQVRNIDIMRMYVNSSHSNETFYRSRETPTTSDDGGTDECSGVYGMVEIPAFRVKKKKRPPLFRKSPSEIDDIPEGPTPIQRRLFESLRILTVDIGATRTKMMYQHGTSSVILAPVDTRELWSFPDGSGPHQMAKLFRARLSNRLVAEVAAGRLPSRFSDLNIVVFSVPGTVDLGDGGEEMCTVRNMPSVSPHFKGFNFKQGFTDLFPGARIYAVADNMAAAMGVASFEKFQNCQSGLILVLGTAPAVSTFYRGNKKSVELAIWQSWVWFTKIPLVDRFGYCGGLRMEPDGRTFRLRDRTEYKIPHAKARIRFAIDSLTWKRLRGRLDWIDHSLQGNLPKPEAASVWSGRVQEAVNALAARFHQVYGRPDTVVVLGGNGLRCVDRVTQALYTDPDYSRNGPITVPVYVPSSDEEQQTIHMRGLAQAGNYRIEQVYAAGPDPLARGWTRGGEIYLWVKRRDVL
jgi:hypothetical protein